MNQVEVGRHRQVTGKLVVRLNANRPYGNVRATAQQVKQPHTEVARKTLVNDLQSLQTLTNDATLGIGVVGANIIFARCTRQRLAGIVAVSIEQRINFGLRKNTVAHSAIAE